MILFNGNKKGVYFFLIDVLIAAFIFLITTLTLFSFRSFTPSLEGTTQSIDNVYSSIYLTEISDIGGENPALLSLELSNYSCPKKLTIDECLWLLYFNLDVDKYNPPSSAPKYSLWMNYSRNILSNATSWLEDNYGVKVSLNGIVVYDRNTSLRSVNGSLIKLSRKKITVLTPNITFTSEPVISEVTLWN